MWLPKNKEQLLRRACLTLLLIWCNLECVSALQPPRPIVRLNTRLSAMYSYMVVSRYSELSSVRGKLLAIL